MVIADDAMGGIVGGAAGVTGSIWAWVRWATGCAGMASCGSSTIGACGGSMFEGFSPLELGAAPLEVGGHPPFPSH